MAEDNKEKKLSEMTEDEMAAEQQRKVDEAKKPLEEQLKSATEELDKLKKKDFDFSKVKEGESKLIETIEGLKKDIKSRDEKVITDKKAGLFDAFAGSDAKLREKLEESYGKLNLPEGTPEEIEARMKEAFTLATGSRPEGDVIKRGVSAASGGRVSIENKTVDPKVAALADAFAANTGYKVSADDIKKFGGKK